MILMQTEPINPEPPHAASLNTTLLKKEDDKPRPVFPVQGLLRFHAHFELQKPSVDQQALKHAALHRQKLGSSPAHIGGNTFRGCSHTMY